MWRMLCPCNIHIVLFQPEENVYRAIPMFIKFSHVCAELGLDGFLYEIVGKEHVSTVQVFIF